MAIALRPSAVTLPPGTTGTVLDFLAVRFPAIERVVWVDRLAAGKVTRHDGTPVSAEQPCRTETTLFYFREVDHEPEVPSDEEILLETAEFLVVLKPAGLPVHPTGPFVRGCLLTRLAERLGEGELSAAHRLDLETAGLLLVTRRRATRHLYHELFAARRVLKEYQAIAFVPREPAARRFRVENRLEPGEPFFRMRVVQGEVNARTSLELAAWSAGRGLFHLWPETGKKHQLRLHLSGLGFPIVGDRLYPDLLPAQHPREPLALLASRLAFMDPASGLAIDVRSPRPLALEGTPP